MQMLYNSKMHMIQKSATSVRRENVGPLNLPEAKERSFSNWKRTPNTTLIKMCILSWKCISLQL